ncbi:hypothetical protein [Streptomyces sp. ODS28]|uniref:hypothetical protein n=1 Tax=Streptomyces sp. ODS28 TaxID=3136688 RepID=UPI0031E5F35C
MQQSLRLAPIEGGEGAEQVRSMLGALGEALPPRCRRRPGRRGEPMLDLDALPLSAKQLRSARQATACIRRGDVPP